MTQHDFEKALAALKALVYGGGNCSPDGKDDGGHRLLKGQISFDNWSALEAALQAAIAQPVGVDAISLAQAFCQDNDSDSYPFNGEEYDFELAKYAFEWLLRGTSNRVAELYQQSMTAPVQNETGRDVGLVPYYDDYGTKSQKIGRKIYHKALSDRRGFREDQIGIDGEDDVWLDIFEDIGVAAIDFVNGGSDD